MKYAVLLSGMPGNLDFSLKQIKYNIIDPLNADLFIYFWYTNDKVHRNCTKNEKYNKTDIVQCISSCDVGPVDIVIDNYSEQKQYFDAMAREITSQEIKKGLSNISAYFSQWYCVKKSFERLLEYEKENNVYYDVYIRMRTEVAFDNPINEEIVRHIDKRLLIPLGYGDGGKHLEHLQGINDFMAFGNKSDIQIYTSLFDHIIGYSKELSFIHSETHLLHHLLKNNVKIMRINFPGELHKYGKGFPFSRKWTPAPEYPGINLNGGN